MALPAAAGMFCNIIFSITDAYYAGWLGAEAQAALAFSFPLYFIVLSLCVGISQAVASRAAAALGGKKSRKASRLAGQSLILAAMVCLFIWLVFLPLTGGMLALLGAKGDARVWAEEYSGIIFGGAPAFLGAYALNGALQAGGNTTAFRNSIAAAAAFNIILDPALMFGWFGLPVLGVAGIAYATVIAQAGCAAYLLHALSGTAVARRWRRQYLRPHWRLLGVLAAQAAPAAGRMLCINAGFFIITAFVGYFSAAAVAGYGIALRLEQLFLVPMISLETAMLAYAGQNFGGRRPARVAAAYFLCLKKGWTVMAAGAVTFIAGGGFLTGLFSAEEEVIRQGRNYLLLAAAAGPLYVVTTVAGSVLMSAGKTGILLIVNVLRLATMPALLSYLLAVKLGMQIPGIWLSLFICNAAAAAFMHRRCLRLLRETVKRRALAAG